jgi:hypothetical protein
MSYISKRLLFSGFFGRVRFNIKPRISAIFQRLPKAPCNHHATSLTIATDADRYPLSPQIRTLTAIRDKLRPSPMLPERQAVPIAGSARETAL